MLVVFPAARAVACSGRAWGPDDLVENQPVYSANGRFCSVVRWSEGLADFTSERAGTLFHLDPENGENDNPDEKRATPTPRTTVTTGWYESVRDEHRRIGEVAFDVGAASDVLVADSGRYLVAVRRINIPCGSQPGPNDALITIYSADSLRSVVLTASDVLTGGELYGLSLRSLPNIEYTLRHESDVREVLVLTFGPSAKDVSRTEERRVDLATAALLDEKRDIRPQPRVYITPASDVSSKWRLAPAPDCAAAFQDQGLVRVDSERLFAALVDAPLPPFPRIGLKAGVRAALPVDVIVSESGDVLCTRHAVLFDFDIAEDAARQWKFRPFLVDGKPVKAIGELLFHFEDLDPDTWKQKNISPFR